MDGYVKNCRSKKYSGNASQNTSSPFNFSPSGVFEGNDGSWSTFIIRVGTPAQTFRVLISTTGQETWTPLVYGCADFDPLNCGALRGVQSFQNAPSGGFRTNLIQNSGGLTLNHSIVAGIGIKHFMLGIFGLSPGTTNFDDFNDPQPSFMGSLKTQSLIPSLSFGYHAGASYSNIPASLILGGHDTSQFDAGKASTVRFNMNDSYALPVALQVIQASGTLDGVVTLLPEGIMTTIDSTIPEIWLPIATCEKFERSFGLQMNNATGRYLVNDTIHSKLKERNPVITFKLGNQTYGGETLNIVLPYSAFDLQVNYPIYPNATNYFPLSRAMDATQYVIRRTFLQEASVRTSGQFGVPGEPGEASGGGETEPKAAENMTEMSSLGDPVWEFPVAARYGRRNLIVSLSWRLEKEKCGSHELNYLGLERDRGARAWS
ncbi:aspartic peptidase domain-containing protein [Leptodontidium sp. 2 PMI_412]|nr:aspartic peptidase domain-containing protein [Leptodontidium sp. 2 PMI_412]